MSQIQAGTTYGDGGQVTATNLNAHVNNAALLPGAISDQPAATPTTSDSLLLLQSNALKKVTVSQLQTAIVPSLTPYLLRDGSAAMTGQLNLVNATPTDSLHATPKAYVDTGLATKQPTLGYVPVNKAGDTMLGSLTLSANPSSALEAATKQYVDTGLATKQATLGFTPVNKAGDTGVGAMSFSGAVSLNVAPTLGAHATNKTYVDAGLLQKINVGGATVGGNYLFTGKLRTSNLAEQADEVITKAYFDNAINTTPKIAASCYFFSAVVAAPTIIIETGYLTVVAVRAAGSQTCTINYSSLAARYSNNFFIAGQYIGVKTGTTGIVGRLYKIESVNAVEGSFTIITAESTALNTAIKLTLVFDSTTTTGAYNVKSVYWDNFTISKYYVNYVRDTDSGSVNPTQILTKVNWQASGSSNLVDNNGCFAMAMRDVGRTTNHLVQDVPEGHGATSFGSHIGFFYAGNDGQDNGLVLAASFIVTHF